MTEAKRIPAETMTIETAPVSNGASSAHYITADDFFRASGDVVTEEVYVPLVKGTMIFKALTAADVQRVQQDATEQKNGRSVPRKDRDFNTMLFFHGAINPDGSPFFRRSQIEQLHTQVSYAAIQPGVKVVSRLSGLDDESLEAERKRAFEGNGLDG